MYPAAFDYHRASSVADALALMERYGEDAKIVAGGQSLLPLMKLRFVMPGHLIDIGRLPELSGISESDGYVVIGALTRHREVASSTLLARSVTALADAASAIGDVQVRNRGTIGGSVAHADPAADMPAVLLASGAEIVTAGPSGERRIPADQYFTGTFTTSLGAGELITRIRIPVPPAGSGSAYVKRADAASGYAVVGVAAFLTIAGGAVKTAAVALTGLAPMATRLRSVEAGLGGRPATVDAAMDAGRMAPHGLTLYDDDHGTAAYKANLAAVYASRASVQALTRAVAPAKAAGKP